MVTAAKTDERVEDEDEDRGAVCRDPLSSILYLDLLMRIGLFGQDLRPVLALVIVTDAILVGQILREQTQAFMIASSGETACWRTWLPGRWRPASAPSRCLRNASDSSRERIRSSG